MNYRISTDNDSRKKKCKYQLSWISDEATLSMAAEYRFDSSSHNRKRRHRRSTRWIHDNVRKKIARDYQKSHEWCVRRNIRNSRRALQYLQRLRNNARGISSKILIVITKALLKASRSLWGFPARGERRNLLRRFFTILVKFSNFIQLFFVISGKISNA